MEQKERKLGKFQGSEQRDVANNDVYHRTVNNLCVFTGFFLNLLKFVKFFGFFFPPAVPGFASEWIR